MHYILRDRVAVPVDDFMEWAMLFEAGDRERIVAQVEIGDVFVSTVFIGLDHNWGEGPPLVFETMIFGGEFDQYQYRYSTWAEAEAGHAVAVGMVEHERDLKTNMTFDEWQAEAARLIEKRRKNRE
jgi:hypothetical protein